MLHPDTPQVVLGKTSEDMIHRHHVIILDRPHALHQPQQLHECHAYLSVVIMDQLRYALGHKQKEARFKDEKLYP